MDRARLLSDLERQRKFTEGRSPLYHAFCAALQAELSAGDPPWLGRLLWSWAGRTFATWYEAPNILLASLHREALQGGLRLEPASMLRFLGSAPAAFWERLSSAPLQTNEAGRAPGWMLPACVAFLGQRLPFHLVDMGTSAGLTLIGDYLEREWVLKNDKGEDLEPPARYQDVPYPVLSRIGLDRRPRRLEDPEDRLWLKASIWPDDAVRLQRFERTTELFLKLAREANGPRLHACEFAAMPGWVASHIPPHPEEGLLLYNSQATDFLTDADYAVFREGVQRTLEPWGERGLWVEFEMPRGQQEAFHEITAHRVREGKFEATVLATLTSHPKEVRLLEGWDFLLPREPVQRRVTIEEPEKQLKPGTYRFPVSEERP